MESPAQSMIDKMQKYDDTVRQLLAKLPIEQILIFRERTKELHTRQLQIIGSVLTEKGYIEPHLEGIRKHAQE